MTDDQETPDIEPQPDPPPERIEIMIGKRTMEEYFAKGDKQLYVRRGEMADAFVMFIDKATFAEAMDVLNVNLLNAIQGAVAAEVSKLLLGEEESEAGIITKVP